MCEYCRMSKCPSSCPNHEPTIAGHCVNCGREIYVGDEVYKIDNDMWCEDCISDCHYTAELP